MLRHPDVQLAIPATHRYLNLVGALIVELLAREEGLAETAVVSYNVQLAVQEICANIVDHSYGGKGGRIELGMTIARSPWRLEIDLSDTGHPFNPELVAAPDLDEPQEGGYGLFLARALLDNVCYSSRAGRNRWRLVKYLEGGRDAA